MVIKTRRQARLDGDKHYFTNKPCKNGHIAKRNSHTGRCIECHREYMAQFIQRPENKEKAKLAQKVYYEKTKQHRLHSSQTWAKNNREKSNQIKRAWRKRNKEAIVASSTRYNKMKRADPFWQLSKNVSTAIWKSLKKEKNNRHWESLVDFTHEQLVVHIEKQFKNGMTWENYGSYWHLDHIKPRAACISFKEAWELTNLQPLLAQDNLSKNSFYNGNRHFYTGE